MQLHRVELVRLRLPLVAPFTTSFGTQETRLALLVRVEATAAGPGGQPVDVVGWGECVAGEHPLYSSETVAGASHVLATYLVPMVVAAGDEALSADAVHAVLRPIVGHHMAKAALEMALLDAELRARDQSLARALGATRDRVPSGVSVGLHDTIGDMVDTVGDYLDQGYVRIKLKIKPGHDVELVRAVREAYGDVPLQVDANAAYTLADADHLAELDEFDLLLVEQPLANDDLWQHSLLAPRLATPICLDESIESVADTDAALDMGAASIINVKPGRVGGYLQARAIHDRCRERGVVAWVGGMLETGLGRAANAALAAMDGFTLPGDVSASSRFYREDVTEPFVLEDGHIRVPAGPGLGVEPLPERLEALTVDRRDVHPATA
ncbi:o-succinylbenzoate synthase [Salsipaludibacter albus]|uniref:o-succinylbenzoate synthase n=1 Tax=Salsipaludibacter albus TaxID=2849650 RepID=UPI001EE42533|nr:o-succinylbenzoate synthase [Salsipaludibacter albus]MBY5161269.1 o-succinylbenzoate synthase [Salsipaludibacter albus]